METRIKGRYGSVYYFGYEEPFLFTEQENEDDKENDKPHPVEEEPDQDEQSEDDQPEKHR